MVEISLDVDGSQRSFLSIPLDDIRRLSTRPFKWLRYVLYCICGARGDLSAVHGGPPVDYDSTELVDDNRYFYRPSSRCIFVDHEGLNERMTSTNRTPRRNHFRRQIMARDGELCVITRDVPECCDAAHIIPRGKGDEYILTVVRDRWPLYENKDPPPVIHIHDVENGVFLAKHLHAKLGIGEVAFLKTPNYGLDPTDILRVEPSDRGGPVPTDHFTLHRLAMPPGYDPVTAETIRSAGTLRHDVAFTLGLNVDALFGSTNSLPSVVILDYVYGIAAYKQWNSMRHRRTVHDVMGNYRKEHYINIPTIEPRTPSDSEELSNNSDNDESRDPTYVPGNPVDCHDPSHPPTTSSRYTFTRTGDEMAKAMDDVNAFLMSVLEITPEEASKRREKRREEEELKVQEASRSKVMEWMKTADVGSS
ncbi:hypothetical protein H4582DRAFT_2128507 [Lactarius indigo]|nr:hypothetical protein H4582DRAFT_2128507 [Lactarius indigo]